MEVPKCNRGDADASHFAHAVGPRAKSRVLQQTTQHFRQKLSLVHPKREAQDAVAWVAEAAVPEALVDREECRLPNRQQDFGNPIVEDLFTRPQFLDTADAKLSAQRIEHFSFVELLVGD